MELSFSCSPVTKKYLVRLIECQKIVMPVALNILLTLACWVGVYEMKVDEQLVDMLFGNSGLTLSDALLNGFCSALMLVCVAFVMLAFAMYDLRHIVQFWLYSSCVLLLFMVSSNFFYALLLGPDAKDVPIVELWPVALCSAAYGLIGMATYFTKRMPAVLHQVYVVTNCSLVSLYYLRCLPGNTAWVVLVAVACWDVFAVLSPYGPLNLVQSKAKDYSADVLRFLMFSASESPAIDLDIVTQSASSSSSSSSSLTNGSDGSDSSSSSEGEEDTESVERTRLCKGRPSETAEDALNDDNFKLGMGDFVFYGLLVGRSATSGSCLATSGCVCGILYGLIVTLVFLSSGERTTPALPVSIFLGMFFHMAGLQLESIFSQVWIHLFDVPLLLSA